MSDETTDEIYGGNFFKISDLKQDEKLAVVIRKVRVDTVGDKKKIVLTLDIGKDFVCNKTNAQRLSKNFGTSKYAQWEGKRFKVFVGETQYAGKDVPCLRVVKEYDE